MELIDACIRIEQAQEVLSVWMEANISDDTTMKMMGSLMTILDGVSDAIKDADQHFAQI